MKMKAAHIYIVTENFIGGAFAKYGAFISRHAWKIILCSIIINTVLSLGMIWLNVEIDIFKTYPPIGNEAKQNEEKIDELFSDRSKSSFYSIQASKFGQWAQLSVRAKSGNFLNRDILVQLAQLNNVVQNITALTDDGSIIKMADICVRNFGTCVVDGAIFWQPEFLAAVDMAHVPYPVIPIAAGMVDYSFDIRGNVTTDKTGQILTTLEYIKIKYHFGSDAGKFNTALKWVTAFNDRMRTYSSPGLDISWGHFRSYGEELNDNVMGDMLKFVITFGVMIVYSFVCTLSYRVSNQVGQRLFLGAAGVLAASMGIGSGFGISAVIGVDFMAAVGVVPFLVIGIGLDDMFILLSGLAGAQGESSVEGKIAATLRNSGVGITITTVTDLVAFLTGAASSFPVVRNFSIYTALSVLFCYINHITFFAACLVINERRISENRHFFTCKKIKSKLELQKQNKSKRYTWFCGGNAPKSRREVEGAVDKFIRWGLPKIVLTPVMKILTVVLFAGYLAAAIYGCVHLKTGMEFSQTVREDSYYYRFAKWEEDIFPGFIPVSFVFPDPHVYSDKITQMRINDVVHNIKTSQYFDNTFELNWLNIYSNSDYYNDSSQAYFISGLQQFLREPQYNVFRNDVIFDVMNTTITSSRIYFRSRPLATLKEKGDLLLKSRDITDSAEISCFANSPFFILFEADVTILEQTLKFVGIALVIVFVITCLFMPHPILIIFVTIAVSMTTVGVFGFLHYIDVSLSYITMIELIMSIGFSVDFSAHICHGYMISKGINRNDRVKQSIDKAGAPIFHGAMSTILGVLVLLFAGGSYLFKTFSAVLSFILIFGIAHALLLLPVILSWIGPKINMENNDAEISPTKSNGVSKKRNHLTKDISVISISNGCEQKSDDCMQFDELSSTYNIYNLDGQTVWTRMEPLVEHSSRR